MEEQEILIILKSMEQDPTVSTKATYKGDGERWPGNTMSFVEYHMDYLKRYPTVQPQHYLSNLRLRLVKRA